MYVWVVLQICVVTNALHTLCISMYHYDCFYICKDLTEGEINQSINSLTNKEKYNHGISSIEIEGKTCSDGPVLANAFSAYFSSIAEKIPFNSSIYSSINSSMNSHSTPDYAHPINYLKQVFSRPFPDINLTPTTAKVT